MQLASMRTVILTLLATCAVARMEADLEADLEVTPIGKVLVLMNKLKADQEKEKTDEATTFAKFDKWCKDQSKAKANEIAVGKQSIEKLKAKIEKGAVLIKKTDMRIKELQEDVGRWEQDLKAAAFVRSNENTDFTTTVTDLTESLVAMEKAIKTLNAKNKKTPQAKLLQTMLLQVASSEESVPVMPAELQATLDALAKEPNSDDVAPASDEDNLDDSVESSLADSTEALLQNTAEIEESSQAAKPGYAFQSGGVVDLLGQLKDKFGKQKAALEKEEAAAASAYAKMSKQLADNAKGGKAEIAQKSKLMSQTQKAKAEDEGTLKATQKELSEDTTYLKDTKSMCLLKTNDFKSRQKLRGEEIASLSKAISIIGGDSVKGAGERQLLKHRTKKRRAKSFAHLRSEIQSPMQAKIAVFLSERASALDSTLLFDVAQRIEADPFKKVKKMVKDLMVKLVEEGTAEMEQKGWCDRELTTNKQTRDDKTSDVAQLTSDIETLTAAIARLTQDNAKLTAEIKELDAAMIASTKTRDASKASNQKAIKEAKGAIAAVTSAIGVLKDFYTKSGKATAFVQDDLEAKPKKKTTPKQDAPKTFDKSFQGNQAEGAGVIGTLEVILSDFTRLDSETTSGEATEAQTYKDYMFESQKDRMLKAKAMKYNEAKKTEKQSDLTTAQSDLKNTQAALDAALKYYEKLKPKCVDSGIKYAERKKKREEEIASLQGALKLLEGGLTASKGSSHR